MLHMDLQIDAAPKCNSIIVIHTIFLYPSNYTYVALFVAYSNPFHSTFRYYIKKQFYNLSAFI